MTVKLNCSSSGSVALSAPASTALGADVVLNLPSHAGSLDRLERAGNILQVVQAESTTAVSSTDEDNYVDTSLTATITPTAASNKILIMVNQSFYNYQAPGTYAYNGLLVLRDSTTIYTPNTGVAGATQGSFDFGIGVVGGTTVSHYGKANITLLDSPNTTSAVTYKTRGRPYGTSGVTYQHNRGGSVSDSSNKSTITLMEVAA